VNDVHGNCIVGIVEMFYPEDVEEILTSTDRISIGGRRPYIWKVEAQSISERIKETYSGIHLEVCQGRWYIFQVKDGRLQWCRRLPKLEAIKVYRQYLDQSGAQAGAESQTQ
jgi:hypothetical protein